MSKLSIQEKYKKNFFKSSDMEDLYKNYPDPWRLQVDGHDRFKNILFKIDELFRPNNPKAILEVGCGEGIFTKMLARRYVGTQVFGFDISRTAVERAHKIQEPNSDIFVCDLGKENIHLPRTVEVILLGDVLYYLENNKEVEHAIDEFDRILAPNGCILLTEFLRTRKYSNKVAEKFKRIFDLREVVRYQERPIDGAKNSQLTYRLIVYKGRTDV